MILLRGSRSVRKFLWYLKNPPSGLANVVITTSSSVSQNNGGAISLYNVAQQGPEATAINFAINPPSSSISTSINTVTNHAWVVDSAGSGMNGNFQVEQVKLLDILQQVQQVQTRQVQRMLRLLVQLVYKNHNLMQIDWFTYLLHLHLLRLSQNF